jgi:hypothetical protein
MQGILAQQQQNLQQGYPFAQDPYAMPYGMQQPYGMQAQYPYGYGVPDPYATIEHEMTDENETVGAR